MKSKQKPEVKHHDCVKLLKGDVASRTEVKNLNNFSNFESVVSKRCTIRL